MIDYWGDILEYSDIITKIIIIGLILVVGALCGWCLRYKKYFLCIIFIIASYILFYWSFSPKSIEVWIYLGLLPTLFVSLLFLGLIYLFTIRPKASIWNLVLLLENDKPLLIENIKRGVSISGAAGSGKTKSIFVQIVKHASEFNFSGINYDYKNCEITKYVNHFFQYNEKIKVVTVSLDNPQYSHRINPLDPIYFENIDDLTNFLKVFFINIKDDQHSKTDAFFDAVPQATLRGVIWRLRCDYPEYCTLPHAIIICLTKPLRELADFIAKNELARLTASAFFSSFNKLTDEDNRAEEGSNPQLRGVKASLDNALSELVSPNLFYVLSASDFHLQLNNTENPIWMNIVNNPSKQEFYSPYIAFIISVSLSQMQSTKNKNQTMLLLDEAPTLKLPKFSRIPSTVREFNICTVYCTQDIALSYESQGRLSTRGILANLSSQHVGKVNDPETIQYFKKITEETKEKDISKSYSGGVLNKVVNKTHHERWTSKHKTQDFMGLKPGQFIVYRDGKDEKVQYKQIPVKSKPLEIIHPVTDKDIKTNFDKIIMEAKNLQ